MSHDLRDRELVEQCTRHRRMDPCHFLAHQYKQYLWTTLFAVSSPSAPCRACVNFSLLQNQEKKKRKIKSTRTTVKNTRNKGQCSFSGSLAHDPGGYRRQSSSSIFGSSRELAPLRRARRSPSFPTLVRLRQIAKGTTCRPAFGLEDQLLSVQRTLCFSIFQHRIAPYSVPSKALAFRALRNFCGKPYTVLIL